MFCSKCQKNIDLKVKYCQSYGSKTTRSAANVNPLNINRTENNDQENLIPVDKKIRFINFVIDTLILIIASDLIFSLSGLDQTIAVDQANNGIKGIKLLLAPIYYILFEGMFQTSIGKIITGTKVIAINGAKPSIQSLVIRTLTRLIPLDPWSYLGVLRANHTPFGWHDTWSKTLVVRKINKRH